MIIIFFFSIIHSIFSERILFSSEIFRHGARYPLQYCPPDVPCTGELTSVGMRQQYNLGKYLKKRYIEDYKLLSEEYNVSELLVKSAIVNRTLDSVNSQLYGLYEGTGPNILDGVNEKYLNPPINENFENNRKAALPNNFQPIPVQTEFIFSDFLFEAFYNCKAYSTLFTENISSNFSKEIMNKTLPTLEKFKKPMGLTKIPNFLEAFGYVDTLLALEYMGKPFPSIFNNEEDKKNIDLIWKSFMYGVLVGDRNSTKIISSNIMNEIANNMNGVFDGVVKYKLVMYSGHDVNLASILSTLNVSNATCQLEDDNKECLSYPAFASSILFELLENETGSEITNSVRIIYNGTPLLNLLFNDFINWTAMFPTDEKYESLCKGEVKLRNS